MEGAAAQQVGEEGLSVESCEWVLSTSTEGRDELDDRLALLAASRPASTLASASDASRAEYSPETARRALRESPWGHESGEA